MIGNRQIALLYPWMEPEDTPESRTHLLTTALYWDQARTIVPFDLEAPFRSDLAREAERSGFLRRSNVSSDHRAVRAASEYFKGRLDGDANGEEDFRLGREDSSYVLMYPFKMTNQMRMLFEGRARRRYGDEFQLRVPVGFAAAYMHKLAQEIALSFSYDAVLSGNDSLEQYIDGMSAPTVGEVEGEIVQATIGRIAICSDTSVEEVVAFRKENAETLRVFRTRVRSAARTVAGLADPRERASEVQSLANELIQEQEDLKRLLDAQRIPWFDVAVVVTGGIGLVLGGGTMSLGSLLASAASEGLLGARVLKRTLRKRQLTGPTAYLLQAERNFA